MSLKLKVTLDLEVPLEVAAAIQKGEKVDAELKDCLRLADQDSTKKAVTAAVKALPFEIKSKNAFAVFVQKPDGKVLTLEVRPSTTVHQVAEMIQEKEGISKDEQTLFFRCKTIFGWLENDPGTKLGDLKIGEGSTIDLHVAPRSYRAPGKWTKAIPAGANAAPPFFDFPVWSRGARMYGLSDAHIPRLEPPEFVKPPNYDYFSVRIRDLGLLKGVLLNDFYSTKTALDIAKLVASTRNVPEEIISLYHKGKVILSRAWNQEERRRRLESLELLNIGRSAIIYVSVTKQMSEYVAQPSSPEVEEVEDLYD